MRWQAAPAALVLLALAALVHPDPEPAPDPCELGYEIVDGQRINLYCATAILYETRPPDYARYPDPDEVPLLPFLPSFHAAIPIDLRVDGEPGCAAGPVGTTEPVTLSAAFTLAYGPPPTDAVFEYGSSNRGLLAGGLEPGRRAVHEIAPGELTPGETVRWRVRATAEFDRLVNWSPWCAFTVAADAPDLRNLDPAEFDAILELGLRPERHYTVALSPAQGRTALEAFGWAQDGDAAINEVDDYFPDEEAQELEELAVLLRGQLPGSVTLTGVQWSTVALQVAQWAGIVEEGNVELDPESQTDTAIYWTVVDQISTRLGGPPHPRLGYR